MASHGDNVAAANVAQVESVDLCQAEGVLPQEQAQTAPALDV